MDVAIAGGHGKIARRLARLLVARGDHVRGLIRHRDQADDLREDGSEPVFCDLEQDSPADLAEAISGADAVVFAAGAGPGSGAERKLALDRDGALRLLDAARSAGVERYVIVSSIGAEDPPEGEDVFSVYLRAKAEADEALMASDRAWTVVRPVSLTDDPGGETASVSGDPVRGEVSRDAVAAVLAAVLREPRTAGTVMYVSAGQAPVGEAVKALVAT